MEAENYLANGYGIRLAMEKRKAGWTRLEKLGEVWQPSRLKGIQVTKEFGTPFLAATQVFDLRPVPRKFLSLDYTANANDRFAKMGMILVTCSGSVGRAILASKSHEGILISHDLLRILPQQPKYWGWIYAYLRAPQTRAMMSASQYGHIIKHLEVTHLNTLPIPLLQDTLLEKFRVEVTRILELRNKSYGLMTEAEQEFADNFPSLTYVSNDNAGFSVRASEMFNHRRRLDGGSFVPSVKSIIAAFNRHAQNVMPLSSLTKKIFVPGRFKHVYGDGGSPYLDSADILEVNPDIAKFVLSLSHEEQENYRVEVGWLLIPCSGQVYGNIGHTVMATDWHRGKVLSNHILRVCPAEDIRSGYLQCVLGHPLIGRPLMVRFAFGSSVPELAAEDISTLPIPRLGKAIESELADKMEKSARARAEADLLEEVVAAEAEAIIDRFVAGDTEKVIIAPSNHGEESIAAEDGP
jgi:hypothetical protein